MNIIRPVISIKLSLTETFLVEESRCAIMAKTDECVHTKVEYLKELQNPNSQRNAMFLGTN